MSCGPETKRAVAQFQQELIDSGYLERGSADGIWGKNTDAAFTQYIKNNVIFLMEN